MPQAALITEIDIAAAPARVWAFLADFPGWSRWNPFIRAIAGDLTPGARLTTEMHPSGGRPMTFRPMVDAVVRGESFGWRGRLLVPGLFDGHHTFRLAPIAGGTQLIHAESFTGLLLLAMDVEKFRPDFIAMNLALKAEAERG
jgi:hypothetical protein